MKKIIIIVVFLLLGVSILWSETGREIMQSVMDNQKAESSAMDMEMNLVEKSGNISTRRLQTLLIDDEGQTKSITLFMEPASVRNTRFLIHENESRSDDQWIYLPALRKVKRIAAADRSGSFMGSDFSYSDMSSGSDSIDDSNHQLLREEQFNGFNCYVVQSILKEGNNSEYGKHIFWVDKRSRLTVKVQFYSLDRSRIIKELVMEDLKQIQGHWVGLKTTMTTLATGHKTIVNTKQVKFDIPVNPQYFTTNFLQTGRAQ